MDHDVVNPGLTIALALVAGLTGGFIASLLGVRLVRSYVQRQLLFRIPDTPVFPYPAFAVYQQDGEQWPSLQTAVTLLRDVAAGQPGTSAS